MANGQDDQQTRTALGQARAKILAAMDGRHAKDLLKAASMAVQLCGQVFEDIGNGETFSAITAKIAAETLQLSHGVIDEVIPAIIEARPVGQ